MKTLSVAFCLLVLVMTGCGASPDSLAKEQIQILDDLATAMENDAPQTEIDAIQDRVQSARKKFEALDLSTTEIKALAARYEDKVVPLTTRIQKALMKKATNSLEKGMKDIPGFPKTGFPKNGLPGFGGN